MGILFDYGGMKFLSLNKTIIMKAVFLASLFLFPVFALNAPVKE
jgi:hypothetical protein